MSGHRLVTLVTPRHLALWQGLTDQRGRVLVAAGRPAEGLGIAVHAHGLALGVVLDPPTADDDAAPTITTAALEATASDPASDPVLSARLEDYILTWADPGVITPSFLATKWLRSLRRDIRRDLPTWLGTTGAVPEARPPAPKARGAWADDADRTPQPPARKPGGKPELMDPDRLLSCLTRLADYGKLGDPNAPLRVAIERTFKVRAMANPNPVVLTLALAL